MIAGAGRAIRWSADNLPLSVTANDGVTQFEYDGDGSLAAMTAPSSQQPTYYFGSLVERAANGTMVYSYFMGPTLVARRSISPTWYHQDHLGSVRLLTDKHGNVTSGYSYSSYGVTVALPTQQLDEFGFTSQRRNPSTATPAEDPAGLIYMNARFYDATLGRFISPDTIIPDGNNPQTLNRYAYAQNSPISYRDPTGREAESPVERTQSDSYNPEDPFRYNHRGGDPWATEIADGLNQSFISSLDGSTGADDAVSASSEQSVNPTKRLGIGQLQCQLCTQGFQPTSADMNSGGDNSGDNFWLNVSRWVMSLIPQHFYTDINVSFGWGDAFGPGLTAGVYFAPEGFSIYGGPGIMTSGLSFSLMYSQLSDILFENSGTPTPGWTIAAQALLIPLPSLSPMAAGAQVGIDSQGAPFWELGVGSSKGFSITAYYVQAINIPAVHAIAGPQ